MAPGGVKGPSARIGRCHVLVAGVLLVLAVAAWAPAARAVILPGRTIDGPSEDIVGFGGAAEAEDGSGGIVYVKRVEGVPHIFVSRLDGGVWSAPVRVDGEEQFAGSWPRIGAADGGELVVVWATPFATSPNGRLLYELLGAVLGPGGTSFGPAQIIDGNIQEATGTSPDLAISSTAQGDVVYRVVEPENTTIPPLRTGDVVEKVKLAHFNGVRWSSLGAINRDPGVSMRPPTEANAPKLAVGPTGNGVVVWQEPEIEGVARIWARRFFGSAINYVMPVSAAALGSAPLAGDADAPAIAVSPLGLAGVAYRQAAGPGSPLPGPRIFLNVLPDGESESGAEFKGAIVADGSVAGGAGATVGPPSIDVDEQQGIRLLYDSNGTPRVIEGDDKGLSGTLALGPGFSGAEASAESVMNPQGGGVSAWPSADAAGHPAVAVREDFPGGAVQTGLVAGGAGGEVAELAVGRSGLGDGLVGFRQGQLGSAAIVVSQVTAPPVAPLVTVPKGWVRPRGVQISWTDAVSAVGSVAYRLIVDGHFGSPSTRGLSAALDPKGLRSGVHEVQVLATDADGSAVLTAPSTLRIDGTLPAVRVTRLGRAGAIRVTVTDRYSGVAAKAISVSFGDGRSARGRARLVHVYAHPGLYRVTVHVRNRLGSRGVARRWVSVG